MTENKKEQPQITIADIASIHQILMVCSRRGAFELTELKAVGELGEKIAAFLAANTQKPVEAPEEAPEGDTD